MEFLKRNGWKITWVALGILAFVGTLGFLSEVLVQAPAREAQAERLAELRREIDRQKDYDQCLSDAYTVYSANWDSACRVNGEEADCSLYPAQSKAANDQHAADQKRCDLRYGK